MATILPALISCVVLSFRPSGLVGAMRRSADGSDSKEEFRCCCDTDLGMDGAICRLIKAKNNGKCTKTDLGRGKSQTHSADRYEHLSCTDDSKPLTCENSVQGAEKRNSAWRQSKKCKCPEDKFIVGEHPACIGRTGAERYFRAPDLVGKSCRCAEQASTIGQSFDGNPMGWNRYRRCDHTDYEPRCGACEGIGGIVWSDKPEDIILASCEKVADKDEVEPSSLIQPVWGANFSVLRSAEILIGKKNDPACFQAFPYNDSSGPNCYKPQEVKIFSDMLHTRTLRIEANQAGNAWGLVGNVTSTIYHQGGNMWIINRLPLGVTQTICTKPREAGDPSKPIVNPVQFNWTSQLFFVAREKIDVEYGVGMQTLDHWAFGPHHAWTNPKTGIIVRMWQPFNGLQIFEPGTFKEGGADPKLFEELSPDGKKAPKAALKGGSTFRIKCADDGFPTGSITDKSALQLAEHPIGQEKASLADLQRARTKVPRAAYKGNSFGDMSKTLNKWLVSHAPNSRECDTWTVQELQELQVQLYMLRDPQLNGVYQVSGDRRKLPQDLEATTREWDELNKLADTDPELARIHRDGHCHQAVMWYVHHLPESVKHVLKDKVALPLLANMRHSTTVHTPIVSLAAVKIHKSYDYMVSCASCHSAVFPPMK